MRKTAPTCGNPDSIGADADRDAGIRRIHAPARDCDPRNSGARPSQCREPVADPHASDDAIPHTGRDRNSHSCSQRGEPISCCGGVSHGVGVSCGDAIPDSQRNSCPDAVRAGAVAHSTGRRERDADSDRASANSNRHAVRYPDNIGADGQADCHAHAYTDSIGSDAHRDSGSHAN